MKKHITSKIQYSWKVLFALCFFSVIGISGGYWLYQKSVKDAVYKNTISFMDQLADHDIKNIDNTIQDKQEYLHNLVQRLRLQRENKRQELSYQLSVEARISSFDRNAKVLLRAHGEPPETYQIAQENNIEIIDATCPVVLRLQKRIKQEFRKEDFEEKQIVIYGKNGHAEVLGLVGQTGGQAIVIESAEEAKKLDFSKSIRLFSQTTKSLDEFQEIVEYIKHHISPDATFEYYDTICRQVANRMPNLREFAATHDLIFFVSGKKSSNGKMLFEECLKVNANSHLIDNEKEIDPSLLQNVESIGVCGATSTPKWLMEKIHDHIRLLIKD